MTGAEPLTVEIAETRDEPDALFEIVDDLHMELLPVGAYGNWIATDEGVVSRGVGRIRLHASGLGAGRGPRVATRKWI